MLTNIKNHATLGYPYNIMIRCLYLDNYTKPTPKLSCCTTPPVDPDTGTSGSGLADHRANDIF